MRLQGRGRWSLGQSMNNHACHSREYRDGDADSFVDSSRVTVENKCHDDTLSNKASAKLTEAKDLASK